MDEQKQQSDIQSGLFVTLVLDLYYSAMISLGKLKHPESQEIVRDLDRARYTIDMMEMLETKTKGNLSDEEEKLLKGNLTNLRLTYINELKVDSEQAKRPSKEPTDNRNKDNIEQQETAEKQPGDKQPSSKETSREKDERNGG